MEHEEGVDFAQYGAFACTSYLLTPLEILQENNLGHSLHRRLSSLGNIHLEPRHSKSASPEFAWSGSTGHR